MIANNARYQKMYTEKYKQDMDFVIIGDHYIGPFINMDVAQKAVNAINSQCAPKPKRTKQSTAIDTLERMGYEWHSGEWTKKKPVEYEYLKAEFDSAWKAVKAFEDGEELYTHFQVEGWVMVDHVQQVVPNWQVEKLYRRTEKQVDWQDAVISFLLQGPIEGDRMSEGLVNELNVEWDLVTKTDFLEMCRVALRARGEL